MQLRLQSRSTSSFRLAIIAGQALPPDNDARVNAEKLCVRIRPTHAAPDAERAVEITQTLISMQMAYAQENMVRMRQPSSPQTDPFAKMRAVRAYEQARQKLLAEMQGLRRNVADCAAQQMHVQAELAAVASENGHNGWLTLDVGGASLAQRTAFGLGSLALRREIPIAALRRITSFVPNTVAPYYEDKPFTMARTTSTSTEGLAILEFEVGGLAPDCEFAIELYAGAMGRSGRETVLGSLVLRTDAAEWQLCLQRAALAPLILPFAKAGFTSAAQWARLVDCSADERSVATAELCVSTAQFDGLANLVAELGFVTKRVQLRLVKERHEIERVAKDAVMEWQGMTGRDGEVLAFVAGDSVREKRRGGLETDGFAIDDEAEQRRGVVVGVVADDPTTVLVRFRGDGDEAEAVVVDEGHAHAAASDVPPTPCAFTSLLLAPRDVFLSHAQGEAQNQVLALSMMLGTAGVDAWYDMDAERLCTADMVRGVATSRFFLIYLSRSYFSRWFCRLEAQVARVLEKTLIVVYEADPRHGGNANYIELVNEATKLYPEWREYLCSTEAIPMARRQYQRKAVVAEIARRAGVHGRRSSPAMRRSNSGGGQSAASADTTIVAELRAEMAELREENAKLWEAIGELRRASKMRSP